MNERECDLAILRAFICSVVKKEKEKVKEKKKKTLFNSVHYKQWFKIETPNQFWLKAFLVYSEQLLL